MRNEIKGKLTVEFSVFSNHSPSEAEQVEIKGRLIAAISDRNIWGPREVAIKTTAVSEVEK